MYLAVAEAVLVLQERVVARNAEVAAADLAGEAGGQERGHRLLDSP